MKGLTSLSGKVFWPSLMIGVGALILVLAPPRNQSPSALPARADESVVSEGLASFDPTQLGREQQKCRAIHERLAGIVQRLGTGSLTLEQATTLAEEHIRVGYPRFLLLLETSFRANTPRQPVAHHLVRPIGPTG